MARFKFGRPVSLRWNGLLIEGPAETEFQIPDEYYEEFNEDIGPVEPTLVWLDTDEAASIRARIATLELASASFAILDAKGDLISAISDNTATRVPVGTDGQVLTADSTTTSGLAWATNVSTSAFGLRQYVKNTSGVTINKGKAVYVTGATGTNVTVGLADYDAEATSSKTLGLMESTVAHNGFGYVVTEGLLTGFDTTPAPTEGVAVWLGNAGSLIYGSPPSEPYHTVYLGVVSRKNVSNGEVFVKVQNGYELTELHNVSAAAPADNDLIQYDTASGLWKNESLSTAGIAPATHAHAESDVTNLVSDLSAINSSLSGKASTSHAHDSTYVAKSTVTTAGDLIVATGDSAVTRLGVGTTGQVLTASGGSPTWASPTSGSKVYYQTTEPTGGTYVVGDMWVDSDDATLADVYLTDTFPSASTTTAATPRSVKQSNEEAVRISLTLVGI